MTEKSNNQPNLQDSDKPSVADDLIEVAEQGEIAELNGTIVAKAFRDFQDGKITGSEYSAISEYYGTDEGVAKNAVRAVGERINNNGQPLTPTQRLGRWLTRHK